MAPMRNARIPDILFLGHQVSGTVTLWGWNFPEDSINSRSINDWFMTSGWGLPTKWSASSCESQRSDCTVVYDSSTSTHVPNFISIAQSEKIDYIFLIWPNGVQSVSFDRALGRNRKFWSAVTPWERSRGLKIPKPPFASVDPVGAYRSGVGPYSKTIGPPRRTRLPWPWPLPWMREKITVLHHSLTSSHTPSSFTIAHFISERMDSTFCWFGEKVRSHVTEPLGRKSKISAALRPGERARDS